MKQNIVKDLTTDEIRDRISEERANYARLKMSHAVSAMENPLKIRSTRRLIARLETEYKKRSMTAASQNDNN
ncbi:MAG TPA: 50S ribosomal protein L29 [Bacteroidia bacterium]|nr:50S ribosomal protein L29 [Bacteroidia bacterium]